MKIFFCALITFCVFSAQASIESILNQKSQAKFNLLKKQGPQVYSNLKSIAFDDNKKMSLRWQAFMAMAKLGEKESMPEVEMALDNKDWFLRDAALKVLPLLDQKKAFEYSKKALNDPALIVRTQAVDNLSILKQPETADILWKELYKKDNYHKNQSLWIRRHIVEALAEVAPKGSESQFIKVLDDHDVALYKPAIKGLEKLTGQKLGDVTLPPIYKRHLWKNWFAKNSDIK